LKNIKKIAVGYCNSFALSNDGEVYAFGKNEKLNSLGLGTSVNMNAPQKLKELSKKKIIDISVGEYFGLALSSNYFF
jgi:alpha-tubulin suppressor-like RCC1 family protein